LIDKGYLKRAALLLFHSDPEKFVTGAFIKIGIFRVDSDLLFQDDIHGNLFEQVEETMKLLLTKYTKAMISYRGLLRIETYEYPEKALQEVLELITNFLKPVKSPHCPQYLIFPYSSK
jgi:ATP-dependent DNA helicase RecG